MVAGNICLHTLTRLFCRLASHIAASKWCRQTRKNIYSEQTAPHKPEASLPHFYLFVSWLLVNISRSILGNHGASTHNLPVLSASPGHLWWSPLLVFNFVHSPHGPLHILNANKALVQTQVVAHSILERKE